MEGMRRRDRAGDDRHGVRAVVAALAGRSGSRGGWGVGAYPAPADLGKGFDGLCGLVTRLRTSRWKPGRSTAPEPERPRSSSIVVSVANPWARAVSANAYCRRWL